MKKLILGIGLLVASCVVAKSTPSTLTAWVLTGSWQHPDSQHSPFTTIDSVRKWEATQTDMVFGSLQDLTANKNTVAIGYMYAHKFDCRPDEQLGWIAARAYQQDIPLETAFLHYQQDTIVALPDLSSGLHYLLQGEPLLSLYVHQQNYATARLPLQIQVNDQLITHFAYPITSLLVTASKPPRISIPILDEDSAIKEWREITIQWQQTDQGWLAQLSRPFSLLNNRPIYRGRSLNTGDKSLQAGFRPWSLQLTWSEPTQVERIATEPWLELDSYDDQTVMVFPGWDPANDRDNDGYIDSKEWQQRANKKASARFPHQARLIPTGKMWSGSCWYRTNFSDAKFNQIHASWYQFDWQRQGLSGAYNDDMAKLLGKNQFTLFQGGLIREMAPLIAGELDAEQKYGQQLAQFFTEIKHQTKTQYLAANISELNLWQYQAWPQELKQVVNVWLREHYLYPTIGLAKLQHYWEHFALVAQGDISLVMSSTKTGLSQQYPSQQQAWQQDITTGLALYYLFNVPQQTYYHSWNQTFVYGSGNTKFNPQNPVSSTWYQSGVPKNWAYYPQHMLAVDIGEPTLPPDGYRLVKWVSEKAKADSQDTQLGTIPIYPSHWFWLKRDGWWDDIPKEGVIARQYSKGLVLYRASREAKQSSFYQVEPINIVLPDLYQRVNFDGTLSPASQQISIKGYEGIVLKRYDGTEP
ncbi:hypothetical protein I8Y06_001942 [Photobacterium damselae]|nr:hypothetical protein [Photobacterium damselae]